MAEYPGIVLTNAGLDMIAESQTGKSLIFTKIKIGDGLLGEGESISILTALKSPKLDIPIQGFLNQGNGQVRLRYLVDNSGVPVNQGFFAREVGVYAKLGETGTEKLYAYTNGGNKVDWISDKNTPMDAQIFDIFVLIGNASNVTINVSSATYATLLDLKEHNEDGNAHSAILEQHNKDSQAHDFLQNMIKTKGSNLARNTVLIGPLSSQGVARYLRDRYSENLCVGGTAISGGDSAGRPRDSAFDGSTSTYWSSSQSSTGVNGVAYIGYAFSSGKHIRKIKLNQSNGSDYINSAKIQSSIDGSTWGDVLTTTLHAGVNEIILPASTTKAFWRILANSNVPSAITWNVIELEMYELLNPELTDGDIILQANTLLSFAAGFGDVGPLEHPEKVPTDISLMLAAAGINMVPLTYTDDLCVGGTAISGGDYSGCPASYAFDNTVVNAWTCSQMAANQLGNAWIGYNFGTAKQIRRLSLTNDISSNNIITSVKVQYSSNGTIWNDACTQTVGSNTNIISVPAGISAQYWRVLANSNLPNGYGWNVREIEMYETLQTHYLYADRNKTTGVIALGSTKQKPRIADTSDIYTDNLCVGGAAISSGDYSTYTKENACDSNPNSDWRSNVGTAFNTRYIGYDFGIARHIRKIIPYFGTFTASAKVQRSNDGLSWYDVTNVTMTPNSFNPIYLPLSQASRYWRILGDGTTLTNGSTDVLQVIGMIELTMHEIATELLHYSPAENRSRWYDGNAWADVERIPLGSANVDSAGKIVSISLNPYGVAASREQAGPLKVGEGLNFNNGEVSLPYALVVDEKPALTSADTISAGAWRTRVLNTIKNNLGNIISLNNNQITILQSGTYRISGKAPASAVNMHKARIQNITTSTTMSTISPTMNGSDPSSTDGIISISECLGIVNITGPTVIELQHYVEKTYAGGTIGIAGSPEVFSIVEIWKVG